MLKFLVWVVVILVFFIGMVTGAVFDEAVMTLLKWIGQFIGWVATEGA